MSLNGAIIFDMDGLMVDTEKLAIEAWQDAARAENTEISMQLCVGMIGLNQRDSERLLVDALGPAFPLDRVRVRFFENLQARLDAGRIDAKPGLYELLDFLDSLHVRKAIATSSQQPEATKKLAAVDVLHRFPLIVTSDRVTHGKPAPDLFLLAAKELNVVPSACTVLEDSEAGIRAAYAAGMRPLMVPDIKPPSTAAAAMAAHVFSSLKSVRQFFEQERLRNLQTSSSVHHGCRK